MSKLYIEKADVTTPIGLTDGYYACSDGTIAGHGLVILRPCAAPADGIQRSAIPERAWTLCATGAVWRTRTTCRQCVEGPHGRRLRHVLLRVGGRRVNLQSYVDGGRSGHTNAKSYGDTCPVHFLAMNLMGICDDC